MTSYCCDKSVFNFLLVKKHVFIKKLTTVVNIKNNPQNRLPNNLLNHYLLNYMNMNGQVLYFMTIFRFICYAIFYFHLQ